MKTEDFEQWLREGPIREDSEREERITQAVLQSTANETKRNTRSIPFPLRIAIISGIAAAITAILLLPPQTAPQSPQIFQKNNLASSTPKQQNDSFSYYEFEEVLLLADTLTPFSEN